MTHPTPVLSEERKLEISATAQDAAEALGYTGKGLQIIIHAAIETALAEATPKRIWLYLPRIEQGAALDWWDNYDSEGAIRTALAEQEKQFLLDTYRLNRNAIEARVWREAASVAIHDGRIWNLMIQKAEALERHGGKDGP